MFLFKINICTQQRYIYNIIKNKYWSNDWWKFSFAITGINVRIYWAVILPIMFNTITILTVIFDQTNLALESIRDFFQKNIYKSYRSQNRWTVVFIHSICFIDNNTSWTCHSINILDILFFYKIIYLIISVLNKWLHFNVIEAVWKCTYLTMRWECNSSVCSCFVVHDSFLSYSSTDAGEDSGELDFSALLKKRRVFRDLIHHIHSLPTLKFGFKIGD